MVSFDIWNKSTSADDSADKTTKRSSYVCNFCRKEFPTSHALGGHQNGHKRERAMAKLLKDGGTVAQHETPIFHPYYYNPFSNINRTPLGFKMDPRIYNSPVPPSLRQWHGGLGHDGWSRPSFLASSSSSSASFVSQQQRAYIDRSLNNTAGFQRNGVYEYPFFTDSAKKGKEVGGKKRNGEEGDETDGIDLTLKL